GGSDQAKARFARVEADAKKPRVQRRGAAEGCKANFGILSILPSKFAPSTKRSTEGGPTGYVGARARVPSPIPYRSCEFPAGLEMFPCAGPTNSLPSGAGNLPQPFDAAAPIQRESSP